MARYREASCRLCRREGAKLFLKGQRCFSENCAFAKRGYAPGEHGRGQERRQSEYGLQLREKQKAKRIYGVLERQFKRYLQRATRMKGIAGENLLRLLESRLDNIVYRMGFAPSRKSARQLIRHRHFLVNERVVNVPSYQVRPGDIIRVRKESAELEVISDSLKRSGKSRELPWLEVDKATLKGFMVELPKRDEIPTPVDEHLVIELYSK
ncbi:MAG TPA: 30S ribosomal protein S4 [Candidatus Latescibacteria bacterium]|nr:30S ribosomal protein S4 [Candidatus Latescibacterota bacterium]